MHRATVLKTGKLSLFKLLPYIHTRISILSTTMQPHFSCLYFPPDLYLVLPLSYIYIDSRSVRYLSGFRAIKLNAELYRGHFYSRQLVFCRNKCHKSVEQNLEINSISLEKKAVKTFSQVFVSV